MDAIANVAKSLGPARLAIIGGVLITVAAAFLWIIGHVTEPQFKLLFSDLSPGDSAQVVSKLEAQNIPYRLSADGTTIQVPSEMVARTRLSLAEAGLPAGGSVGYELFDTADTLGTTDFMQNVNLVRALEGELARTIRAIDGVRSARVHLVLPKRELFAKDRQPPSASVLLQMVGSKRLSEGQVKAIQHLVAAAVPAMNPQQISIVDAHGTLLSAPEDGDSVTGGLDKADERRQELESRLARTVEQLLESTLGTGKVRANVTADMDYDRINTSEEIFNPDGQVVRSTQTVDDAQSSQEKESNSQVTAANNLPDPNATQAGATGSASNQKRTEETVNYEISKKVINHVRETGLVKRLSVAVLVDGVTTIAADGTTTYQPLPDEEIARLTALVKGAIGFDAKRNDTVEIINMRFATVPEEPEETVPLLFGFDQAFVLQIGQYLVMVILSLLVVLLIIRPLLIRALEALPAPAAAQLSPEIIAAGGGAVALAGGAGPTLITAGDDGALTVDSGAQRLPMPDGNYEEMIDLDQVEGRVKASSVKRVATIVERHPEEALNIVRSWLHAEE